MKCLFAAFLSCAATASPSQPFAIPFSGVALRFDGPITKGAARRLDDGTTTLVDQDFGMVEMTKTETNDGWKVAFSSTFYIAVTIVVSVVDVTAARFSWTNSISLEGNENTCASNCKILVSQYLVSRMPFSLSLEGRSTSERFAGRRTRART